MTDIRRIAYETLLAAEGEGVANSLIKDVLDKYSYLDRNDRSFLKRLTEGVTERKITLDHVISQYSKIAVYKMKKPVKVLLRMGTYQLLFMEGVADHAAISETVDIIKKTPLRNLSGFVNAVLRNIQRGRDDIAWPDRDEDLPLYLSVMYSCPLWIVKRLIDEQGEDNAETLLKLSLSVRPVTARINHFASSDDILSDPHIVRSDILDEAVFLEGYDRITDIEAFANGSICIQDISSMLVVHVSGIREGDTVIDMCAAPGGKSLNAADIAELGKVISIDVSEDKIEKIRENITRCGFTNIETRVSDSTVFDGSLEGLADVVIADVPCSGLGVMGRKNDIKYNVSAQSVDELVKVQRAILKNAVRYVKDGGILMFSTCTCIKSENDDNRAFLIDECDMKPVDFYDMLPEALRSQSAHDGFIQLYGKDALTDGFYIAKFTK